MPHAKKVKEEPTEAATNGRNSPGVHPNGLVDSKAKNKVTCQVNFTLGRSNPIQVCRVEVCNTARQRHVFMIHVKQDDMYKCPQCDYVNSNSIWEAKKHTAQHGKNVEPISNEDKYKTSIMVRTSRRKIFSSYSDVESEMFP